MAEFCEHVNEPSGSIKVQAIYTERHFEVVMCSYRGIFLFISFRRTTCLTDGFHGFRHFLYVRRCPVSFPIRYS